MGNIEGAFLAFFVMIVPNLPYNKVCNLQLYVLFNMHFDAG